MLLDFSLLLLRTKVNKQNHQKLHYFILKADFCTCHIWTVNLPQISSAALSKLSVSSRSGSGHRMSCLLHATTSMKNRSAESHFSGRLSWILLNKFLTIGWPPFNFRSLPGASAARWRQPYDSRGQCRQSRDYESFFLIVTSWVTLD